MDGEIPGDEQARPHHVRKMSGRDQPENGEAPPLQEPSGQVGSDSLVKSPEADWRANWVDLTQLPSEPKPREWILPGFIPAGRVTLLYGLGGVGKTILALQLAICLACNLPFLGRKLARNIRPVLYISEDDVDEVHRRLDAIARGLGLDFHRDVAPQIRFSSHADELHKLLVKVQRSRQSFDGDYFSESIDEIAVHVTGIADDIRGQILSEGQAPFFVIDPLVKTHDGDENSRTLADQILTCLERSLCFDPLTGKRDRSSALVLAHPSKRSQTSGTNAWPNASRSTVLMGPAWFLDERTQDKKDPLQVALYKANYASPNIRETVEHIEEGHSTYLRWIDQHSVEAQESNQARVIEIVRDLMASGQNLSPKRQANNNIIKLVREHPLNETRGRRIVTDEQIENLLHELRRQRRLVPNEYKGRSGEVRIRMVLADDPID